MFPSLQLLHCLSFTHLLLHSLTFPNRTTVPVARQYLPQGIYDVPLQSKQVSYAIFLSQTTEQTKSTEKCLHSRNIPSDELCINQTPISSEYIRMLPRILPHETKKHNPLGGIIAEAQLGIWMAGFKIRMEKLLRPQEEGASPRFFRPMPCVKVHGFEWWLYRCCATEGGEIVLYGPIELGSTLKLVGCY